MHGFWYEAIRSALLAVILFAVMWWVDRRRRAAFGFYIVGAELVKLMRIKAEVRDTLAAQARSGMTYPILVNLDDTFRELYPDEHAGFAARQEQN